MGENKIFCHACGAENPGNAKFCISCGTKLTQPDKADDNTAHESSNDKKIQPSNILLIALSFLLVGIVILFYSGAFDRVPKVTSEKAGMNSQITEGNQQGSNFDPNNPHAGADMEKLKEITELEKTLEENPEDHQSLVKLAHLLNDTGFYSKAINKYKEYLKIHPGDADVRVDMGVCYFQLQDFDNAVKEMKEALKYQPNHQIAHFNIGIVNFNKGDVTKAKEWWEKAIKINPNTDIAKKAKELIDNN